MEFQSEKKELQKVIEEQKVEVTKANERATSAATASGGAAAEEVGRLTKDLATAKDELKESAIEKERCQSQLEMLVRELEQKQVGLSGDEASSANALQHGTVLRSDVGFLT